MPKRKLVTRHCRILPETGYGYIRGEVSAGEQDTVAFEVAQFVEKPNLKPLRPMWVTYEYYWNSGMFLFRAGRHLEESEKYRPIFSTPDAMSAVDPISTLIRVDEEAFLACRKSRWITRSWNVRQMPLWYRWMRLERCRFPSSLWEISTHTAEGNVCHGDVINHKPKTAMCTPNSGPRHHRRGERSAVVQTKDAVLTATVTRQDVKNWSSRSVPMVAMSIGYIAKSIARGAT